jgi:hypothetical protein
MTRVTAEIPEILKVSRRGCVQRVCEIMFKLVVHSTKPVLCHATTIAILLCDFCCANAQDMS